MFIAKIFYSPKASPDAPYCLHILHVDEDGNEDCLFPPSRHYYSDLDDAKFIPNLFHYPIETIRC